MLKLILIGVDGVGDKNLLYLLSGHNNFWGLNTDLGHFVFSNLVILIFWFQDAGYIGDKNVDASTDSSSNLSQLMTINFIYVDFSFSYYQSLTNNFYCQCNVREIFVKMIRYGPGLWLLREPRTSLRFTTLHFLLYKSNG